MHTIGKSLLKLTMDLFQLQCSNIKITFFNLSMFVAACVQQSRTKSLIKNAKEKNKVRNFDKESGRMSILSEQSHFVPVHQQIEIDCSVLLVNKQKKSNVDKEILRRAGSAMRARTRFSSHWYFPPLVRLFLRCCLVSRSQHAHVSPLPMFRLHWIFHTFFIIHQNNQATHSPYKRMPCLLFG